MEAGEKTGYQHLLMFLQYFYIFSWLGLLKVKTFEIRHW